MTQVGRTWSNRGVYERVVAGHRLTRDISETSRTNIVWAGSSYWFEQPESSGVGSRFDSCPVHVHINSENKPSVDNSTFIAEVSSVLEDDYGDLQTTRSSIFVVNKTKTVAWEYDLLKSHYIFTEKKDGIPYIGAGKSPQEAYNCRSTIE